MFYGSFIFSSADSMGYNTQSRRDDLIVLCYILIYTVNGGELCFMDPGYYDFDEAQRELSFDIMCERKKVLTPQKLCCGPNAQFLVPFVEQVMDLEFEEEPNYG